MAEHGMITQLTTESVEVALVVAAHNAALASVHETTPGMLPGQSAASASIDWARLYATRFAEIYSAVWKATGRT